MGKLIHVSLQTTFHTILTLYVLLRMVVVWSKVVQWKPVSYEMKREYYHVLLFMFNENCRNTKYHMSILISKSLNNVLRLSISMFLNIAKRLLTFF